MIYLLVYISTHAKHITTIYAECRADSLDEAIDKTKEKDPTFFSLVSWDCMEEVTE